MDYKIIHPGTQYIYTHTGLFIHKQKQEALLLTTAFNLRFYAQRKTDNFEMHSKI